MITDKTSMIKKDIRDEFEKIRRDMISDLNEENLEKVEDINERLQSKLRPQLSLLFDTLLNYLMADARSSIEHEAVAIQNDFFALELRKKFRNRAFTYRASEFNNPWKRDPRVWAGSAAAATIALLGILIALNMEVSATGTVIPMETTVADGGSSSGHSDTVRDTAGYSEQVEGESSSISDLGDTSSSNWIWIITILIGTAVLAAVAYNAVKNLPRSRVRRFLTAYITESVQKVEEEVSIHFEKVERDFAADFDKFLLTVGNARKEY